MPVLELHISTTGPGWNPFNSRRCAARFIRGRYRAGMAWRVAPGVYGIGGMGCLTFVLTRPGKPLPGVSQ